MFKSTNSSVAGTRQGASAKLLVVASVGLLAATAILSALRRRVARTHVQNFLL